MNTNTTIELHNRQFTCKTCSKCFETKKSLSRHERMVHFRQTKNKNCPICLDDIQFTNNHDYQQHFAIVHKNKDSNNYVCQECGKECKTRTSLILHTKSKCGTLNLHHCDVLYCVCAKGFTTASSLHNHKLRHNDKPDFMCRFCAKLFTTMGQLEIHERVHTRETPFVCDVCGKHFRHRQSLVTHSTLHTGIKPFNCENCLRSFSCVGNLMKHRKTHPECAKLPLTTHTIKNHATKAKLQANTPNNCKLKHVLKEKLQQSAEGLQKQKDIRKCTGESKRENVNTPDCLKNKPEEAAVNNFQEKVSIESKPSTAKAAGNDVQTSKENCEYVKGKSEVNKISEDCNMEHDKNGDVNIKNDKTESHASVITNDVTFNTSVENNDIKKKSKYDSSGNTCQCCNKHFQTKEEYREHQERDHPDMLKCTICDKMYTTESSLKTHKKTFHLGIPRKVYRYICPRCGKQFRNKTALITHEQGGCDHTPKFQCETCNKSFASEYSRKTHSRIHGTKKFLCNYCGKRFHWKSQLKVHERSHTGDKPFSCLYCPKTFAYRESLITHSSIHTGIKLHVCEACGSRFSCIGNLIKHKATHISTCGVYERVQSRIETNLM